VRCSTAGRALASSPIVRHNTACMSNSSSSLLSCICWIELFGQQMIADEIAGKGSGLSQFNRHSWYVFPL